MQRSARIIHSPNAHRGYTMSDQKSARISLEECIRSKDPFVYCVRRSSTVVKIGTTKDIVARVRKLGLTFDDLLCLTPGGKDVEAAIHQRFRQSRVAFGDGHEHGRTEHFKITSDMSEWVNTCRASLGMKPINLIP